MSAEQFEGWVILELMGHRKLAGKVSEQLVAGAPMIRIDVPKGDGFVTQFYAPSALYAMTPTTEELARRISQRAQPNPVHQYELPPALLEPGDPGATDPDEGLDSAPY